MSERASESSAQRRTIADVLADARARLNRPDPTKAAGLVEDGAYLVDTRPAWQREKFGTIPGALWVERNHIEWRLDPTSGARIPEAIDHDVRWVLFCTEGYASSLAAASLQDIGLHRATDIDGGFLAWQAAGLPTVPADPDAVPAQPGGADPR
ncbi:rhodanese-like domain-containing protein [Pseudonocardia endophytica]|uniref:rhodanese-like domain-containing protein n=1 Tax=Pseudonocardia endophytica TaxID=401976 RepID=UPI001FB2EAF1|nr:rhodanese-like domain-containing protein [Pseudonocardia endophytica]